MSNRTLAQRVIPITEPITWEKLKESDNFTRTTILGSAGLALSLLLLFPLGLLVHRSILKFWAMFAASMYVVIFGSAILRILYYRYHGVTLSEQFAQQQNGGEQ